MNLTLIFSTVATFNRVFKFPISRPLASSNPFLASSTAGATPHPPASAAAESSTTEKKAWNPFEDAKKFGELSEEALFGAQFDQIRMSEQGKGVPGAKPATGADPFQSAPFAATKNQ